MYCGAFTAGYNTEDGIAINPTAIAIGVYNAAHYKYVFLEQDEQSEQDRIEKEKRIEKIKQSILSNPPYGPIDEAEHADVNLIAQQASVSISAAAAAYLIYDKDFVDAVMSLID
jgi:NACalpha-BTF3-like transcription factor